MKLPVVWLRLRRCLLMVAMPLVVVPSFPFLSGCSSSGVQYNYTLVEGDILELEARTREMVADGDKGRLSVAASRKFLEQSKAMADLIRVRVGREQQLACLAALDQQYRLLLQKKVVLRSKTTVPLRAALTALVAVRPRQVRMMTASTSIDTTTDTASDWMEQERCRRERERDRDNDRKDKGKGDDDDKKGKKD